MKSSGGKKKKKVNSQVCFHSGSFGNPVQASSLCLNTGTRVKLGIHLLPPPHMIGTNRAGGQVRRWGPLGRQGPRCSTMTTGREPVGEGLCSILWASLSSKNYPHPRYQRVLKPQGCGNQSPDPRTQVGLQMEKSSLASPA